MCLSLIIIIVAIFFVDLSLLLEDKGKRNKIDFMDDGGARFFVGCGREVGRYLF